MSLTQKHMLQFRWSCRCIFMMVWCWYCKSKLFFESFSQHVIEYLTSILSNWRDLREFWSSRSLQLSFPLCRARYIGNTAHDCEVSERFLLPCRGLPLQPEHPCLWTCSTQRASPDLLNGSLGTISPGISGRSDFTAAMPALPLLPWACQPGEGFSPSLTSLLCWATTDTSSSPPLSPGTLPPKLTGELQVFLFSGGKFHLTLSSGTRTDIRFVGDEVLLSEFNKRGTMKRLQLLSKSTAPITEFICIYKWHISEGSPHPCRCTLLPQKTC